MLNALLILNGVIQLAFALFHVQLGMAISRVTGIGDARPLMIALNASGTGMFFFFAYASLVPRRQLVTTHLGRAVLVLIAVTYLVRAAEEAVIFHFNPLVFWSCLGVGLLNLVILALSGRETSRSR